MLVTRLVLISISRSSRFPLPRMPRTLTSYHSHILDRIFSSDSVTANRLQTQRHARELGDGGISLQLLCHVGTRHSLASFRQIEVASVLLKLCRSFHFPPDLLLLIHVHLCHNLLRLLRLLLRVFDCLPLGFSLTTSTFRLHVLGPFSYCPPCSIHSLLQGHLPPSEPPFPTLLRLSFLRVQLRSFRPLSTALSPPPLQCLSNCVRLSRRSLEQRHAPRSSRCECELLQVFTWYVLFADPERVLPSSLTTPRCAKWNRTWCKVGGGATSTAAHRWRSCRWRSFSSIRST